MRPLLFAALLCGAVPLAAQPADSLLPPPSAEPDEADLAVGGQLVGAVYEAPPFAFKHPDGTWDGIAVELWRDVGRELGFDAEILEVPEAEALATVATGSADVAVVAVAEAEPEAAVAFTHAYYTAPLGVAEKGERVPSIGEVIGRVLSPTFLWIVLGLAVLLLVVGALVWLAERHENSDDFEEEAKPGLWSGFWWAGVTMTTIGYGDKAPKTVPGRVVALFWMLVSMGLTAALTATIVSALGIGSGGGSSSNASLPGDLEEKAVGVVERSAAAEYLSTIGLSARTFPDEKAGLRALRDDSLDAFVATAPVLEQAMKDVDGDFSMSTTRVEPQRYAFAVGAESALRDRLGRAVLEQTRGASWQATLERYLGG